MRNQSTRVGTLDDDLTSIAAAVCQSLYQGPHMVWIDDRRHVFIGSPSENALVPTQWIVGTFGNGHAMRFIEDDLRAMAQERSHDSMLD